MIMLTCSCLNVRVHSRVSPLKSQDIADISLPESVQNDPFFTSKAYDCILDLAGVTVSQTRLCKERFLEGWSVTVCTCCMMDMYAKRADDSDRVFVSYRAETDADKICSLMESEKYSPLFKLILPEINDNFIQNIGVEFHNGNIDRSIEVVQSQVSNYLKEEQKAMEVRIRQFTEQQQMKYSNLLQQVRKHKQAMVYLMFKSKEGENSPDDVSADSSVLSTSVLNRDSANESSASTDSAFDRSETSELPLDDTAKQQNVRSLRRTVSNPSRSRTKEKRELRRAPASIDVGGVFDMEELETKEESLSGVSDGESDDSESETCPDNEQIPDERPLFGSSLPMSIPAFTSISRFAPIEDEQAHVVKDLSSKTFYMNMENNRASEFNQEQSSTSYGLHLVYSILQPTSEQKIPLPSTPLIDRIANNEAMLLSFLAEKSLPFSLAPDLIIEMIKDMSKDKKALDRIKMHRTAD